MRGTEPWGGGFSRNGWDTERRALEESEEWLGAGTQSKAGTSGLCWLAFLKNCQLAQPKVTREETLLRCRLDYVGLWAVLIVKLY